jgi:hypothetical protein
MELNELLKELKQEPKLEKTAAAKSSSTKNKLLAARDDAISSTEKTASVKDADVTPQLIKMAEDLANSEAAGIQKEAEFYGAALADGFLTRLNQYATTLSVTGLNKTAADAAWQEAFQAGLDAGYKDGLVGLSKTAATVPPVIDPMEKVAFDRGYQDTMALLQTPGGHEKVAEFVQGYNDAAQLLSTPEGQEKVAEFVQGYNDAAQLLSTPGGQEKVAEFVQGYNDAAQLLSTPGGQEKVAEFVQGYNDGVAMLNKLASAVAQTAYNQTVNLISRAVR